MMVNETIRELLAAKQHEIWAHWMKYLFSVSDTNTDGTVEIPAEKVKHWQRQIDTAYADLSEREKESDRHQADKVLAVLEAGPLGWIGNLAESLCDCDFILVSVDPREHYDHCQYRRMALWEDRTAEKDAPQ